jgi:predicted RNase H-like HicB family nuclease
MLFAVKPAMTIQTQRESDGRWIAEVAELPGVIVYSDSRLDAIARATALAVHVIADRLKHGEAVPDLVNLFAVTS